MRRLTKAQFRFLAACLEFERGPMPRGLPCQNADMRSHGSLLERNLIALNPYACEYVLTPAGRAALTQDKP